MNFDVSVIVPVYGVEKYVKYCVDSILNQTLKSLEVVIVNDCTPDNSMKICEELYGSNERVQLINQPRNMGVGEARNTGIAHARGRYIGFVDSDDQVRPDMYENMIKTADKYDADIVHNTGMVGTIPVNDNGTSVDLLDPEEFLPFEVNLDLYDPDKTTITDEHESLEERLVNWTRHKYPWSIWNQLYRTDFIRKNDIHFSKMRLAEDLVFGLQCVFLCKRYVTLPGRWYVYRASVASSSRSGDKVKRAIKGIDSQLIGTEIMKAELSKMPFFRDNPTNMRIVIEHMLDSIEKGFLRHDFQAAGEEAMRSSDAVHDLFVREFGDKAEYVEFLFYELHKNYPPTKNMLEATNNPKLWEIMRKRYPKYKETGDIAILFEGFMF